MAIDGALRGQLRAGMTLVGRYKGKTHWARVVEGEEGRTRFQLADGREFESVSATATAVMGGIACNGWRFWEVADLARQPVKFRGGPTARGEVNAATQGKHERNSRAVRAAPDLRELIALYLGRCEAEGKSPETIRNYRWTLERFLAALLEDGSPTVAHDIEAAHVYAYLSRFTGLSAESRHRYFREVRCFFNWLVDAECVAQNPFRGMRNVRLPQRIVEPFSSEQIAVLFEACGDGAIGKRDRALLLLLLDTGARCSEVTQLELADLDLEQRRIRILHAKGNKQRVVPFATRCAEALQGYLALRGSEAGPLFVASSGHGHLVRGVRLQSNGLKHVMRRLGRDTGLKRVHAHRFRHTFATWAIQQGARELDVQYLLGHSSPDMVRRYSSSYRSEQAALRHVEFSPADQMLASA